MFIRVKIDGEHVILVNHNCGVNLLAEYLKLKTEISDRFEIDLCHQCGYLTKLHTLNPTLNGLKFLKNRTLYYVVRYQRDRSSILGGPSGTMTHVPVPIVGNNQRLAVQILGQVRKNKGVCTCLGEPSLIEFSLDGTAEFCGEKLIDHITKKSQKSLSHQQAISRAPSSVKKKLLGSKLDQTNKQATRSLTK
ncbi:hypothetical protein O3M35_008992 [Rhynocoris fuscipes]|uniref:Uncharacterized protein n=1 Tax=Rhynocoris fuscipes TaxID=488301 RepID=A0AAW1D1B4_9HEMI